MISSPWFRSTVVYVMAQREVVRRWLDSDFLRQIEPALSMVFVNKTVAEPLDVRGITIGLDGAPPNFVNADFQDLVATNLDASSCRVSCAFNRARISNSRFESGEFDTCRFKSAHFDLTVFDAAKLDSPVLDDAAFTRCSFVGTRIQGRRIQEFGGRRVTFDQCDFRDAVFRNLQLRACTFKNCGFEGVRFEKCLIVGVKFEGGRPADNSFIACE